MIIDHLEHEHISVLQCKRKMNLWGWGEDEWRLGSRNNCKMRTGKLRKWETTDCFWKSFSSLGFKCSNDSFSRKGTSERTTVWNVLPLNFIAVHRLPHKIRAAIEKRATQIPSKRERERGWTEKRRRIKAKGSPGIIKKITGRRRRGEKMSQVVK